MISIIRLFENFGLMKMYKTKFPKGAFKFKYMNKMKKRFAKVKKFDRGVNSNV